MKKIYLSFLLLLSIYLLFSEEKKLNFDELKLSLDECIKLAETSSYEALINKLDQENYDLELIQHWFVYLPEVSYEINYLKDYYESGAEGYKDIPEAYDLYYINEYDVNKKIQPDSERKKNSLLHKINFKQRLFDTNIINAILNSKNHKIEKEILIREFKSSIRHLIRRVYFDTVILEEQQEFFKELFNEYNNLNDSYSGLKSIYNLLNNQLLTDLKREIIDIEESIEENKLTILKSIRKPLNKNLILTTKIVDIKSFDNEKKLDMAIKNSIGLQNAIIDNNRFKKELALTYLDFVPELSIEYKNRISDNMNLGILFNMNGRHITADIIGDYVFYEKEEDVIISKVDDGFSLMNDKNSHDNYELNERGLHIVGKIGLDKLAKAGVYVKQNHNRIKNSNLIINSIKDNIHYNMKRINNDIERYKEQLVLSKNKYKIYSAKRDVLLKDNSNFNIDILNYYERTIYDHRYEIERFFNMKMDLYRLYSEYLQVLDGKTYINNPRSYRKHRLYDIYNTNINYRDDRFYEQSDLLFD